MVQKHVPDDLLAHHSPGTVRNANDSAKVKFLKDLENSNLLTLFDADLTKEGSFEEAIQVSNTDT